MTRANFVLLFSTYAYAYNLMYAVLELLPHFIRIGVYRLLFKHIGSNVLIDYKTYFRYPSKIFIGNDTSINRGCELYCAHLAEGGTITIGNNCALGPNVKILAGGHDYSTLEIPVVAGPVLIDDHVWIGANVTVLPGVHIGEGAVIGAGALVSRDIPAYVIAVGCPAKVINSRNFNSVTTAE